MAFSPNSLSKWQFKQTVACFSLRKNKAYAKTAHSFGKIPEKLLPLPIPKGAFTMSV